MEALRVSTFFCEMSLAKLQCRNNVAGRTEGTEKELMLHDLHLDFCRDEARKNETNAYWHAELLTEYWKGEADEPRLPLCGDSTDAEEQTLLGFGARPWWSVTDDDYIYGNLGRHLVDADRSVELGALLLDARWTHCA